jgi:hypothetical protein
VTFAVALPVLSYMSVGWLVGTALFAALLPVFVALCWRRRPEGRHATLGEAAWWRGKHRLYCENERFARVAARNNELELLSAKPALVRWSSWYWVGPMATLVTLPVSVVFNTATLRVLNLTGSKYTLLVDGRVQGEVETTSAESPAAGRELRVGAGQRQLQAISHDGRIVSKQTVRLVGGGQHLYAPGATDTCFWIERTSYGRQKSAGPERIQFARELSFWLLPEQVDTWFAPSPLPVADDGRSSGGVLTALRQAPCRVAP